MATDMVGMQRYRHQLIPVCVCSTPSYHATVLLGKGEEKKGCKGAKRQMDKEVRREEERRRKNAER